MKFLIAFAMTIAWSTTALSYDAKSNRIELLKLQKADEFLVSGDTEQSGEVMRDLITTFETDRLMTGLVKMAIIYLELGKPQKARIYISQLQLKLLGSHMTPHYTLKLAASYLQAGRLEEASSTLEQMFSAAPVYRDSITEDVKMVQAFIDLEQVNKAARGMILLERKISNLESNKATRNTASAVTN